MAEYLCKEDMNTGEYISRDEALKIFHQCCDNCTSNYNGVMCRACADAGAMDILIDIPAADVQPIKHGWWIWVKDYRDCEGDIYSQYKCSCCDFGVGGVYSIEDLTRFCGNCGARMDGDING